jgi:hypothetical protein
MWAIRFPQTTTQRILSLALNIRGVNMANSPKHAAENRRPSATPSQDDHEGSFHVPEEFRTMNPAKPDSGIDYADSNVEGVKREGFFGSQAWEATSPDEQGTEPDLTREQKRVAPQVARRHARNQQTDEPTNARGRNPDSAMCEERYRPGRTDKGIDR